MPNGEKGNITINKNNTGFPAYLDFDKLRAEGIAYLGKLSGKLWTDHNVHDPGITILEELCYALLDLGYRTNLPVEDILSHNPGDTSKDDNFFTPAEILSCNPLTINDYRKLLIDLPGVKNAWLVPAIDIDDRCKHSEPVPPPPPPGQTNPNQPGLASVSKIPQTPKEPDCKEFLNGLYHVFIETDLKEGSEDYKALPHLIKKTLMAHRNLCEDFEDIYILCPMETGVCATIELEENANAENVYIAIANKLRDFFSPAPVFYTLLQLLEKGKAIEDIFAGRPYSAQSHGFVDTDELEAIKLRKEIHTSDVYNAIFEVEGVRKISKLSLRSCGKQCEPSPTKKNSDWKFHIPKDHIPSFSIACSGFEFKRNGRPVEVDTEKFETLLSLSFTHTGKVPHKAGSPYLDSEIPKGIYHDQLGEYYSIQNDFPRVYGIGDGDLTENAENKRIAWARQLKGYLLFFDQMLANYLSQLKNIRQLFQLKGPSNKKDRHTYFLNMLNTVPEMNKLLRFGTGSGDNQIGGAGSILVYPVLRKDLEDIDTKLFSADDIFQKLHVHSFNSLSALDVATAILRIDLENAGKEAVKSYSTANGCWLFTVNSSAEKWILLGKKTACSESEALQYGASVEYIGAFEKNYRSFLINNHEYTFDIELNIVSYTDYLGLLVENEDLYSARRIQFLNHLLSRFAEKFTDFALLNWKNGQENEGIEGVEKFLASYDDIGRNRGRAYDYLVNGWNNDNISGFEKKIKALSGIENWQKNNLCNFTVELFDEQYIIVFDQGFKYAFTFHEKYDVFDNAVKAVTSAVKAMAEPKSYEIKYLPKLQQYQVSLNYGGGQPALYPVTFSNSNLADQLVTYLSNGFSQQPGEDPVVEHSWIWKAQLRQNDGTIVRTAKEFWHSEEEALKAIAKLAEKINVDTHWKNPKGSVLSKELYYDKSHTSGKRFIDIAAFNIDINNAIINNPGKFNYDVLDNAANSFKISPLIIFDTAKQAKDHCYKILAAAADKENFSIRRDKNTNLFTVGLQLNGEHAAIGTVEYKTKSEVEKAIAHIYNTVKQHTYHLELTRAPETWKFLFQLGYDENNSYRFQSDASYKSVEKAAEAAALLHKNTVGLNIQESSKKGILIADPKNKTIPAVTYISDETKGIASAVEIKNELDHRKAIAGMTTAKLPKQLEDFVKVDGVGKRGTYVYRLVNKNITPAVYSEKFSNKDRATDARQILAASSKLVLRNIPEICMGGDIFHEFTDKENTKWFRYLVKLYNVTDLPGREMVLFESVKAYTTEDDARKAFIDNYLHILHLASDKKEYDKTISLKPVDIKPKGDCSVDESIVFIPATTLELLPKLFPVNWQVELPEYIKTYPIKIIDAYSPEFAALFCSEYVKPPSNCDGKEKKWVYYFSMPLQDGKESQLPVKEWRSTQYYTTPEAAMKDFRYFSRLLKYTGNYFVDCGCEKTISKSGDKENDPQFLIEYGYKIFIHEVLAQSINWFDTEKLAWGEDGIEKFICAMQLGKPMKNYLRQEDCCYSFYTTCGNGLLEHPCKYDNEHQRDKALERLFASWKVYEKNRPYSWNKKDNKIYLNNVGGKPFAQIGISKLEESCDFYIMLAEQIMSGENTITYLDGWLYYNLGQGKIKIQSVEQHVTDNKEEQLKWKQIWEQELLSWACHFPITRTELNGITKPGAVAGNAGTTKYKYCIEIKLPGFNACADDMQLNKPCSSCSEDMPIHEPICHIAWKSACCYSSCIEAMRAWELAFERLSDKKNYHHAFDCECNSFGVNLHTHNPVLVTENNTEIAQSDIIAVNPQCYQTPDEVCAAANTAIKLVNSEGMHLAEHILLRPHCEEDCKCGCREKRGSCTTGCKFPSYPSDDQDPCSEKPAKICFKPGSDPYSFIATVVLPAWSFRFRNQANREVLENLLYKETPAHILLRILWLKPADLCTYETTFKKWNKWLAQKRSCEEKFNPCELLTLLFCTPYDCLAECEKCQPCIEPTPERPDTCAEIEKKKLKVLDTYQFLNQVNDVYCLQKFLCGEQVSQKIAPGKQENLDKRTSKVKVNLRDLSQVTSGKTNEGSKSAPHSQPEIITKARIVNTRLAKYKAVPLNVHEHSGDNPLAAKLTAYLAAANPNADSLDKLVEEIIQNPKASSKSAKFLNKQQQQGLLESAVCYYLDKVCFNGKDESRITALQKTTERMRKGGIDMQSIYNYWDAAEVEKFEAGIDTHFIKHILIGKTGKKSKGW